jgi:hypothetical protein
VVSTVAVAHLCHALGTETVLGGVAWERFVIDPYPGPRPLDQITGGRPVGAHARVISPAEGAFTPEGVELSESQVARHLGAETALIDVAGGATGAQAGIEATLAELGCDLLVAVDVGGDVLARGEEPGLASPLCDAVMLAATAVIARDNATLLAVIGPGCDGELTTGEVLERVAELARAGAWLGTWSVTPDATDALEAAARTSHTEASLLVARCARGEFGEVAIRNGRRTVELGPLGALSFFLDPVALAARPGSFASALTGSGSIEEAQGALAGLGVRTELDYERERAAELG